MRLPRSLCLSWFRVLLATVALVIAAPALAIGSFSASAFQFVVIVKDDGTSDPGGWQEAATTLKFADGRQDPARIWTCKVTIGMPLRTNAQGSISQEDAAEMSADIATRASSDVMRSRPAWLTAEFCKAFKQEMQAAFDGIHKGLGARVNQK